MPINLLGFIFKERKKRENIQSFAPPQNDDGAMMVDGSGSYSTVMDLDGTVKNETELITRYRAMAQLAEVDGAISEIVNESIVTEEQTAPIKLVTDKLSLSKDIKEKLHAEFDNILNLLDFNNEGQDIFRKWYVDGRLYYHMIIDPDNPREGIKELRLIDPKNIKLVVETNRFVNDQGIEIIEEVQRYYNYNQFGIDSSVVAGVPIAPDSICYIHSGVQADNSMILGHLQKALKPSNLLTMCEDSSVIYRLARAPERRIFYIDVGTLPKQKAEQYIKDMMSRYKNKMVFDATTGEIREDKKFMSFMEDYWLPRREGGRGTEISTLSGAENLGEMADVEYFKEKLYQSLNVPVGRLKSESGFNIGRSAEISRDEVKFGHFINRLRNRFSQLFDGILSTQLMLKGIIAKEDWYHIRQNIFYDYLKETYFSEMKDLELMRERLSVADAYLNYVGKYVPHRYVRMKIFRQTAEEMAQMDAIMAQERNDPRYQAIEAMTGGIPGMNGDESMLAPGQQQLGAGDEEQGEYAPEEESDGQAPEDDDDESIDSENLPVETATKNVEKLWRR